MTLYIVLFVTDSNNWNSNNMLSNPIQIKKHRFMSKQSFNPNRYLIILCQSLNFMFRYQNFIWQVLIFFSNSLFYQVSSYLVLKLYLLFKAWIFGLLFYVQLLQKIYYCMWLLKIRASKTKCSGMWPLG